MRNCVHPTAPSPQSPPAPIRSAPRLPDSGHWPFAVEPSASADVKSANRPSTVTAKPVSALPPQMTAVLIWTVFASVARALFSNSLVVGERAQDSLERPLVHASRLNRHGTVSAPLESGAQFFDTTRRTIPPVAHGGLISNPRAFAAREKPDAVMVILMSSIEDARGAVTFAAQEHEVASAVMCPSPVAADFLPHRSQPLTAGRP
jgi:hypothetical protein